MSIKKDQQGIAHLMMIGLAVVVIAAVVGVGLSVSKKNKTTDNSSTSTSASSKAANVAADSTCLATYKDANLCHFAGNSTSFDKEAYKATITLSSPTNGDSSMVLENDGKGNTSTIITANGQDISSIMLGGNNYVQETSGGTWTEYPNNNVATDGNPTSDMDIGIGASGISYKSLGTDACGNLSCFKYQVTDTANPDSTQYVWFDKSKYQLREWQDTTSDGTTDMKITYQGVNITKPSTVQQIGQ